MSFSTTSDASTMPLISEQRLELNLAEIKQKLSDLVYNEQVNQRWKLGIESILNTLWNKVCSQRSSVTVSCQTDEQLEEYCDTLTKSSVHRNQTCETQQEEDNRFASSDEEDNVFNTEEQQDVVEDTHSNSSWDRENEMSASDSSEPRKKRILKPRIERGKLYQCSHCESKFSRKDEMLLHQRTHASVKCDICSRVFATHGNLKLHRRACSNRRNENGSFECDVCREEYPTREKLDFHSLCHRGKKHKCTVCGKAFYKPAHVTAHMVTHTRTTPFRCKLCPKNFRKRGTLAHHVRVYHTK